VRSKIALACAVLMAGIAIWEIIATKRAPAGVPDDAAWRTAAQVVRASYEKGDLIVFAPPWVDPVGRMHLGDLISIDDAGRMDEAKYARVWELSIRGAERAGQPAFEREIDGVLVRRYDKTPATVLADVRTLQPKQGAARLELQEVGFEPHRCLQVNAPARITFTLPAGKLVGYAGIADVFTRRSPRDPAQVAVEEGGKRLASITSGVDDGGVRFETPVAAGEVTFVVTSAAVNRLVCFAAEVRE
jgi:hypothetical protein